MSVSEKELRLRRVQHQDAGEYAWPDLTRAKISLTSFVIRNKLSATNNGTDFSFDVETVSTIFNGYYIWFQYIAMNDYDLYHPIFESILESVQMD